MLCCVIAMALLLSALGALFQMKYAEFSENLEYIPLPAIAQYAQYILVPFACITGFVMLGVVAALSVCMHQSKVK